MAPRRNDVKYLRRSYENCPYGTAKTAPVRRLKGSFQRETPSKRGLGRDHLDRRGHRSVSTTKGIGRRDEARPFRGSPRWKIATRRSLGRIIILTEDSVETSPSKGSFQRKTVSTGGLGRDRFNARVYRSEGSERIVSIKHCLTFRRGEAFEGIVLTRLRRGDASEEIFDGRLHRGEASGKRSS